MSLVTRGLGRPGNLLLTGGLGRRLLRTLTGRGGVVLTKSSATPSLNVLADVGIMATRTSVVSLDHLQESSMVHSDDTIANQRKPDSRMIEGELKAKTRLAATGHQVSEGTE